MKATHVLLATVLVACPARSFAQAAPNAVVQWATTVQPAIHSAAAPRSAGTAQVLHTMVVLAMYDAVVAIEGGYRPYAARVKASPGADARAAVATAAYRTARARVAASQLAYLDQAYTAYLAGIDEGPSKTNGINVGEAVAAAILKKRAHDGFDTVVLYACSAVPPAPGEFEPDAGCPTAAGTPQPADVKLGQVAPFTFRDAARFRPHGPDPLGSTRYAAEFQETRDYGRIDSAIRTAAQTDVAYFWAEHPYVHWNRNLIRLAVARGLTLVETARLFAMVHTAASDAAIAGFEAKYHYRAWRPRTAIPGAEADGNADTVADPAWRPLLMVNHPEYPSGHGFWSTAVTDAVAAFFGTRQVTWTIETSRTAVPQLVQAERTYDDLNTLMREIADARIWAGLHWRHALHDGAQIGRKVTSHVVANYFRPVQ